MIYYNAGQCYPREVYAIMRYYLGSYFYKQVYLKEKKLMSSVIDVIIDSGAWSAFNLDKPIGVQGYIDWIKTNNIKKYITLDVIGDKRKTLYNYEVMLGAGLKPLPVWQLEMNINKIDNYLINKPDVICIGGVANKLGERPKLGNGELRKLDDLFNAYPFVKFHILGNFSKTLWRWPCYSCDSIALLHVKISRSHIKVNETVNFKGEGINKMISSYHALQFKAEQHTLYWAGKGVNHWPDYQIKYNHKETSKRSLFEDIL